MNTDSVTIRESIEHVFMQSFSTDKHLLLLGENVKPDLVDVTLSKLNQLLPDQVFNEIPLVEELFGGMALGLAQAGCHPVIQLNWSGFTPLLYDQLMRIGSWQHLAQVDEGLGITVRIGHDGYNPYGVGGELSNLLLGPLSRIPNLVLLTPSTPHMAAGLLQRALMVSQLVVFLEHKALYSVSGYVDESTYPESFAAGAEVIAGSHITIVSWLHTAQLAKQAATRLQEEGISVELITLHVLAPLNRDVIVASVKKTKRLLVVDEEPAQGGYASYVASLVAERLSGTRMHIETLTGAHVCPPNSWTEGKHLVPSVETIIATVRRMCRGPGIQFFKKL